MSDALKIGDLVWAKMKGFSPWPGRVSNPTKDLKKPASKKQVIHCIFFFGTNNYAWIEENNIKSYKEYKDQLIKSNKSAAFKEACEAIEMFIARKGENPEEDPDAEFDRLRDSLVGGGKEMDPSSTFGEDGDEDDSIVSASTSTPKPRAKKEKASREPDSPTCEPTRKLPSPVPPQPTLTPPAGVSKERDALQKELDVAVSEFKTKLAKKDKLNKHCLQFRTHIEKLDLSLPLRPSTSLSHTTKSSTQLFSVPSHKTIPNLLKRKSNSSAAYIETKPAEDTETKPAEVAMCVASDALKGNKNLPEPACSLISEEAESSLECVPESRKLKVHSKKLKVLPKKQKIQSKEIISMQHELYDSAPANDASASANDAVLSPKEQDQNELRVSISRATDCYTNKQVVFVDMKLQVSSTAKKKKTVNLNIETHVPNVYLVQVPKSPQSFPTKQDFTVNLEAPSPFSPCLPVAASAGTDIPVQNLDHNTNTTVPIEVPKIMNEGCKVDTQVPQTNPDIYKAQVTIKVPELSESCKVDTQVPLTNPDIYKAQATIKVPELSESCKVDTQVPLTNPDIYKAVTQTTNKVPEMKNKNCKVDTQVPLTNPDIYKAVTEATNKVPEMNKNCKVEVPLTNRDIYKAQATIKVPELKSESGKVDTQVPLTNSDIYKAVTEVTNTVPNTMDTEVSPNKMCDVTIQVPATETEIMINESVCTDTVQISNAEIYCNVTENEVPDVEKQDFVEADNTTNNNRESNTVREKQCAMNCPTVHPTQGYHCYIIMSNKQPRAVPLHIIQWQSSLPCKEPTKEIIKCDVPWIPTTNKIYSVYIKDQQAENSAKKKRNTSGSVGAGGTPAAKRARKSSLDHASDLELDASSSMTNHVKTPTKQFSTSSLLDRPSNVVRPDTPPLDVESVTQTLKEKNILPSMLKFGFLGLGIMGSGIVKNLLNSGHSVIVWNRTPDKCKDFVKAGAEECLTPSDVVQAADITFSCVADPKAAKEMVFGNCGVLLEITPSKGYVEMTGIDSETSHDIAEAIQAKGGRYLEAQIQGSKTQAEEGTLVILAAGDRSLFDDCQSCFQAMGRNSFYLGEVGNASKMNLVLQLMAGVTLAGLAEGMALADRAGLQQKDVLEVLELTSLACNTMIEKSKAIIEGGFTTHLPLQHLQKDLKLSLTMGDNLEQPLPLTATANEVFKHAKRLGYGDHDASAVYIRARF